MVDEDLDSRIRQSNSDKCISEVKDSSLRLRPKNGSFFTDSYYRSLADPEGVSARKCDVKNMELLGFSVFSPVYWLTKLQNYFYDRKNI